MSQPGENASGKVIRLEARRVERRVPGIGTAVFRAPSVGDEMRLAQFYDAEAPDHRAFVNETVAATLESPVVDAADVDLWTERARAIARVAIAEAAGCRRDYRRLAGSGLSGDERLYRAMRARYERQLEQLRSAVAAASDNVVRLFERTQRAVRQSGVLESIERNQRQMQRIAQAYTRAFRPAYIEQIKRMNRQFEQIVRPSLPMAIGLPLLRALETEEEPLIGLLEAAIDWTPLVDAVQTAVQQNAQLDAIAKRHLVTALEHLRSRQYVDAEPPLYQGLERAFKLVARQRGIVDAQNRFLVKARTAKVRSVDDLFEHLTLDRRYLRFLRSWVFGPWGNLARHGDLPESEHRRWTLRAFVALLGWLQYCGADERPMEALVARLELEARKGQQTA